MTPEQEQIDPATLEADQSRMSELLTKVSADGHDVLDEPPTPAQDQDLEPSPEGENTAPQPEPEPSDSPTQDEPLVGEGEPQQQEPPTGEDAQQDDYERDLEENEKYKLSKNASQRSKEVNGILKRINKEKHREAKALRKELETERAKKILDEQTEQELNELRTLRSRVAIEQDPEFNEKYVQKIQKHEATAIGLLRKFDLPEETAKFIADNGGLIRFQNSERRMPVGTQDLEGKPFNGTQAEWYKDVMEPMFKSLPPAAQTRLKYELEEALKTAIQRDDALQEARSNPQKFIEQREQQFQEQVQEFAKRADAQFQKEADLYGEIAKPKEVPEKATPAERTAIEQHNAKIDEAKESIRRYIADQTPENLASMAAARAYRDFAQEHVKSVERELADTKKLLTELQGKWDKAKSSAQTSRQQSSVSQQQPRKEAKPYDAAESIKELMSTVPA
jgi:hypothetical protein